MSGGSIGRVMTVLAVGTALILSGCDSSGGSGDGVDNQPGGATSVAPVVPASFNPCEDIPESLLTAEGLKMKRISNTDLDEFQWQGCSWVKTDGYAVDIRVTNITVDMVRDKGYTDTREFTIDGRAAISSRRFEEDIDASCYINVDMSAGSLEIAMINPASGSATGYLDACDLTRDLAERLAPLLPAM